MTTPIVSKARAFGIDLAERCGSTFIQVLLSVLLATQGVKSIDWLQSFSIAGFAAFGAFLTTTLAWMGLLKKLSNPYLDLIWRTVMTFLQTLVGLVVAAGLISALAFNWNEALKTALVAAGVALLKGLIGLSKVSFGVALFTPPVVV